MITTKFQQWARKWAVLSVAVVGCGSLMAANPDNVTIDISGPARYTPESTYTISAETNYTTKPLSMGYEVSIVRPEGWWDDMWSYKESVGGFAVEPSQGDTNQPFGFAFIAVPNSPIFPQFTFDLADYDLSTYNITVTVKGVTSGGDDYSESETIQVLPPVPPVLDNWVPTDPDLDQDNVDLIANSVTAGESISFSVDISAADGMALTESFFGVADARRAANGRQLGDVWDADYDNESKWPSYLGPGTEPDDEETEIDFADTAGSMDVTVGDFTHHFTWTPIAGDADGNRAFTWTVPAGFVTKATPKDDRVFLPFAGADQSNGGWADMVWLVRVDPVNAIPTIDSTTPANAQIDPISEGEVGEFAVTASDTDVMDVLSYTWWVKYEWETEWDQIHVNDAPLVGNDVDIPVPFDAIIHPKTQEDNVQIKVVVSDGDGGIAEHAWTIASIYDENQKPDVTGVTVDVVGGATTLNGYTASVVGNAVDPDDEDNVIGVDSGNYRFVWLVNGNEVPDPANPFVSFSQIVAGKEATWDNDYVRQNVNKGDVVSCRVYAIDQMGFQSDPVLSNAVTVGNTVPVADSQSVFIRKFAGGDGTAEIVYSATDIDVDQGKDTLSYMVVTPPTKGTLFEDPVTGVVTYTVNDLDTEFFDANADTFTFQVSDGTDTDFGTVTVTYRENTPPEILSVTPGEGAVPVDPAAIDENQSIAFSVTATDQNDLLPADQKGVAAIEWYVDGVLQAGRADPVTSDFTFATDYDTIANDGTGHRPAQKTFEVRAKVIDVLNGVTEVVWTATVNDVDRPASAPAIVFNPAQPKTTEDIVATASGSVDPDGDAVVGYSYSWNPLLGFFRADIEGDTLAAANTQLGQNWSVTAAALTNPYNAAEPVASTVPTTSTVEIYNTPPVANAQTPSTPEETALVIQLTADDPDVDDGTQSLVFVQSGTTQFGTLSGWNETAGTVTYTPDLDYNGEDSFTFHVYDGMATSTPETTVTITVTPVNDPPVSYSATGFTKSDEMTQEPIELLATDVDPGDTADLYVGLDPEAPGGFVPLADGFTTLEGGTLTIVPPVGIIFRDSTRVFVNYTPPADFHGVDRFWFLAEDQANADSNVSVVTITVGTPLWYPFFSWAAAADWYQVQVWTGDAATVVLDTKIEVEAGSEQAEMMPGDYIRANSRGLVPGAYLYRVRTWEPVGNTFGDWSATTPIAVEEYGYAHAPTAAGVTVVDAGAGRYNLGFLPENAQGYELQIRGPNNYYRVHEVFFAEDDEGIIPLNQPTVHAVALSTPGTYEWRVRGFNPLDRKALADAAFDLAYTAQWTDGPDFDVAAGADVGAAAKPTGLTPAQGDVIAADNGVATVTFSWNPAENAETYEIYVAPLDGNAIFDYEMVGEITGDPQSTFIADVELAEGDYLWFVIPYNEDGEAGTWSDLTYFHVVEDLGVPTINAAAKRLGEAADAVDVTWVGAAPATVTVWLFYAGSPGWQVFEDQPVTVTGANTGWIYLGTAWGAGDNYIMLQGTNAAGGAGDMSRLFVIP